MCIRMCGHVCMWVCTCMLVGEPFGHWYKKSISYLSISLGLHSHAVYFSCWIIKTLQMNSGCFPYFQPWFNRPTDRDCDLMSRVLAFSSPGPESEKGRGGGWGFLMTSSWPRCLSSFCVISIPHYWSLLKKYLSLLWQKKAMDNIAHPSSSKPNIKQDHVNSLGMLVSWVRKSNSKESTMILCNWLFSP